MYFIGMAFLFTFAASGILAGLNWRRLGKPRQMWPTILLCVVGLVALLAGVLTATNQLSVTRCTNDLLLSYILYR
jgi:hypothetical protein